MARKRGVDPKAKQKKQIVILVVGLVLLGGVLAFQLPRMMKSAGGGAAAAPAPAPAVPAPGGTAPAGTAQLAEAPLVPTPAEGQLVSFSLFETKDPFVQQVKALEEEGAVGVPAGEPGPAAEPELPPLPPAEPAAPAPAPAPGPTTPPEAPAAATTATISINGVTEVVKVKTDFPAAEPLFTLVAVTADSAEIAIAGGEYEDGAGTVTLQKGKTLTLMNTADGARYELTLVSVG
jgi:hypothetical protein